MGSLFWPVLGPKPGRFKGDWAKLFGVVTGETLDLPPLLLSFGDFRIAKDSKEFLSIAAEVKFSRRDPELAMALAKNGGKLGIFGPPGGPAGIPGGKGNLGPAEDEVARFFKKLEIFFKFPKIFDDIKVRCRKNNNF